MKIWFHDNSLSERGTTRSIVNLCTALSQYFDVECSVVYNASARYESDEKIIGEIRKSFEVVPYTCIRDLRHLISTNSVDVFYAQKAGDFDGIWSPSVFNFMHAVFQSNERHGDCYVYVSRWLAHKMASQSRMAKNITGTKSVLRNISRKNRNPALLGISVRDLLKEQVKARERFHDDKYLYLPLIAQTFPKQESFRKTLQIPESAIVLGSLGGSTSFDIPYVRSWLPTFLDENPNFWFLAPNLEPWFQHDRVAWLPRLISDDEKSRYLSTIDAMLHARSSGESFGLAIAEVLNFGKPVLASDTGVDQNHVEILGPLGLIYKNCYELTLLCHQLADNGIHTSQFLKAAVKDFGPEKVSYQFMQLLREHM